MTDKAPKPTEYNDDDYRYLLKRVGAPDSPENRAWLRSWKAAEKSDFEHNPFNTTQYVTGAKNPSGQIQSYKTRESGLNATADTLLYAGKGSYYKDILKGLRASDPKSSTQALVNSPWAAGRYGGADDWTKSSVWGAYQRNKPAPVPRQFTPEANFQKSIGSPKASKPIQDPLMAPGLQGIWNREKDLFKRTIPGAAAFLGHVASEVPRQAFNVVSAAASGMSGASSVASQPDYKTPSLRLENKSDRPFDYRTSNKAPTAGQLTSDIAWTAANLGGAEAVKAVAKPVGAVVKTAKVAREARAERVLGAGSKSRIFPKEESGISTGDVEAVSGRPSMFNRAQQSLGKKISTAGLALSAFAPLSADAAALAKPAYSMSESVAKAGKAIETSGKEFKVATAPEVKPVVEPAAKPATPPKTETPHQRLKPKWSRTVKVHNGQPQQVFTPLRKPVGKPLPHQ